MRFDLSMAPKSVQASAEGCGGYKIQCITDGTGPVEIIVSDFIGGEDASTVDVQQVLMENKSRPVNVKINSMGGSAYHGMEMMNAFQEHGNVTGIITGIAFSAAAMAMMGTKRLVMYERSDFGIHRAGLITMGNIDAMRGAAEWLENVDKHQVAAYREKTGASQEKVEAWMMGTDDGTVFSASEALKAGFADEVISSKKSTKATGVAAQYRDQMAAKMRMMKSMVK